MDLESAELMTTGDPDGRGIAFTVDDLEAIASAFDALFLAGRVPLKFGHGDEQPFSEGQPALGWVERVWVAGEKLLADFADIPTVVYEAIKKGLYKFVSVELLRNVQAGNRSLPWVLDAVALLGADQPAFGNLKDLQSLTLARRNWQFAERVCFSHSKFSEDNTMNDTEKLQQQITDLTKRVIEGNFNQAITAGRIKPDSRQRFFARYGDKATLLDCETWLRTEPRPAKPHDTRSTTLGVTDEDMQGRSDLVICRLRKAKELEHFKTYGEKLDPGKAAMLVMEDIKGTELARRYSLASDFR